MSTTFLLGEKSEKTGMMSNTVVKDVKKINSLIWFRNDLRVDDHSGLFHAIQNLAKL